MVATRSSSILPADLPAIQASPIPAVKGKVRPRKGLTAGEVALPWKVGAEGTADRGCAGHLRGDLSFLHSVALSVALWLNFAGTGCN